MCWGQGLLQEDSVRQAEYLDIKQTLGIFGRGISIKGRCDDLGRKLLRVTAHW